MIGERPAHHKATLAFVTSANVSANVDVALARQLGAACRKRLTRGPVAAIGRALDEKWQRPGDVGRLEDYGVQFDAVLEHGSLRRRRW